MTMQHPDPIIRKAIRHCYEGRKSCSGCQYDLFCPMAERSFEWLMQFCQKIDPSGITFGVPAETRNREETESGNNHKPQGSPGNT